MKTKFELCIVIPCYNEATFFRTADYMQYIDNQPFTLICFVDDGSSDNTLDILKSIQKKYPNRVDVVTYEENKGKAGAVHTGMNYCNERFNYVNIAYLDADLAVSLEECTSLMNYIDGHVEFTFGSRIQRIGSTIERKRSRFLIGRVIATVISQMLDLRVYDTQCGCKVFSRSLSQQVFVKHFISKWLFDVEIFFRIINIYGRNQVLNKMLEIPLIRWVDAGDSKVRLSYFYKLWIDLYRIRKEYR